MLTDVSSKWLGKMGQMHFAVCVCFCFFSVEQSEISQTVKMGKALPCPHDIWMKLNKIFDLIQNNFQNECNEE